MNTDPEYVAVYSLPVCFAKIFHNCTYLEYPSLGRFPDPPQDGIYVPSGGDIGAFCCLKEASATTSVGSKKKKNSSSDDNEEEEVMASNSA